ncbi:hypothetical protein NADFUDRAFT_81434 [Nadsonia fulvescens var. elongata DSM 6958]|uniref:Uncharacterized protein n=1 Tax=Nadsonia fulvescens var. elongata DSM 6958 TaxID=857566 RepID=A0A1E3PU49_9ASCO|nr:hypothetical protein NADFUDRAFT_81434 [Nadsonia fulvescens var. elongata DSM 6958]
MLETDEISCGPLASRLLSALLKEGIDDTSAANNFQSECERFGSETPNDAKIKRMNVEDGVKIKDEIDIEKEDVDKNSVENGKDSNENENDNATGVSPLIDLQWKVSSIKGDYATLEQRLKREFKYVGIVDVSVLKNLQNFGDDGLVNGSSGINGRDSDVAAALKKSSRKRKRNIIKAESSDDDNSGDDSSNRNNSNGVINGSSGNSNENGESLSDFEIDFVRNRQDDEICRELRALQQKLKQTTKLNQARKNRLLPVLREQLAWQEYSSILDDLDKQVDQAYTKRLRNAPKGKKKKGIASTTIAGSGNAGNTSSGVAGSGVNSSGLASVASNERAGLKQLLEKRKRWIEKIGPVFRDPQVMKRIPKESVFGDLDKEIENDDMDELMADNESADEENGVFN